VPNWEAESLTPNIQLELNRTLNEQEKLIEAFLDSVWAERGLSENTLQSYRYDLLQLAAHQEKRNSDLKAASREDLLHFLASRVQEGRSPRSLSRYLSGFRQFYRWLLREGRICQDPSALIESPRLGRGLPKALSEQQVEALLEAPDVGTPLGLRDRAMLELMYATGLRVSELVGLELSRLNLNQGVVRVMGKGDKERLVPMGEESIAWLLRYLDHGRGELMRGAGCPEIFVTARKAGMTRVKPRGRSEGGSAVARAQRSFDHPDLYPHRPRRTEKTTRKTPSSRVS
jgi:integrase/recombinase XerD